MAVEDTNQLRPSNEELERPLISTKRFSKHFVKDSAEKTEFPIFNTIKIRSNVT
jgi:hypothetical protein